MVTNNIVIQTKITKRDHNDSRHDDTTALTTETIATSTIVTTWGRLILMDN